MIVEIVNKFKKDFKRSPDDIQNRVLEIENAKNIKSADLDIQRMEGQKKGENYYRIRVADWRIGCEILQPNITPVLNRRGRGISSPF